MPQGPEIEDQAPTRTALWRHFLPYVVAFALFGAGLYALNSLLAEVDIREVANQVRTTPWQVTGIAFLTTVAGYLFLAGYDWSALRHIGKPLPLPVAMTGGLMAYAFGNTIGLSAISGAAVRWRVYSGLGLDGYDIAAISTFTAASFGVGASLLGFSALALHPGALGPILPLPHGTIRLLAIAAVLIVTLPMLWASITQRELPIGRFRLRAPTPGILAAQIVICSGDIVFSALTLYVLLPVTDFGFPTFLVVFSAAMMAGVLSHVPGGVGVFESVIIAAMPAGTPIDKVAAGLLLFRMIYYLAPFTLALLLLAAYEGWRMLGRAPSTAFGRRLSVIEPALRAVMPLAPLLLAVMVFGSGLWMSVSALLPPMTETSELAESFFPLAFVEGSILLSSALGAGLVVLSLGVVRRSLGAFWLTIAAMLTGAVFALLEGVDLEQASALLLGVLILLPFRRAFHRRSMLTHSALTPGWIAIMVAAVAGFGFVLFFAHKETPYSNELWWQFAADERAPRALRAGLLAALLVGLGALFLLLRIPRFRPLPPDARTLEIAGGIAMAQDNPDAGFVLSGDKAIMLSDNREAFLMFGVAGSSWISYGPPIGLPEDAEEVAYSFVDAARRAGARPIFYEVGPADVPLMLDLGMTLHKMGEEAVVDLRRFSLEGSARKRLRTTYARAGRDGLTLELVMPPHDAALMAELRDISDEWLMARKSREKGFSVGRFSSDWLDRWALALVRQNGRLIAFGNVMTTDRHAVASIDLMRHRNDAPSGTMEFMFTALMLALKERGYPAFSLGMAPLAGLDPNRSRRVWDRFGALIFRHGGSFYKFEGLRAFKDKFDPDWTPHYLATPTSMPPLLPLADAARLIARQPGAGSAVSEAN
ncbi:bifunctional lysylphosphatidylglycerol flippase/synthetase MprF [Paracoccus shanxieyensis]|uniref:Phosphatidylglycerol lysyltransferase n=1 Tax=Paracoccus shanxieyensis TaxID=2675752 RepID=A0A6L6J4A9_9RHOB|nr:bifunctional lysylphosphatidylglycerol flippase/synthetase MprF [Paracoccus shanxieyensis]MTH65564.1 bifunctional lysylphosphatidylglycerol flippase/synthetase MprF [Paracoccus shanxieyensis]MTH88640.1 bifunctional lysylphosphatidylglycerol flippase/synthetase MprF [Paracoccus shanxieyensis]